MNTNSRKTYFGFAALLTGLLSDAFLGANYGAAYMDITPNIFNQLNILTAQIYCILTPLTVLLGVIGFIRRNDSNILSGIAVVIVAIPVAILFSQLVASFLRQ